MVRSGGLHALATRDAFLARSPPSDVARVEERTFICSDRKEDAGPLNNWTSPTEMRTRMKGLFAGSARGRTLYAIPMRYGPAGAAASKIALQLTDSPYVVLNSHIMAVVAPLETLAKTAASSQETIIPLYHSVGAPLAPNEADTPWPHAPKDIAIAHFPETREVYSYGSGYGGNALLGKKCLSLRLGSVMGRDEGWYAEHMAIIGVEDPQGVKKYVAASFPSSCGKTAFSTLTPALPGWKVTLVGDDIAWLRFDKDGALRAINPERGLFGVAPGTPRDSNVFQAAQKGHSLFTNVALTPENDVWWEGLSTPPAKATSWLRKEWTPASGTPAAHANSRFTVPTDQCPSVDSELQNPLGVPISAIIFGGRRDDTVPLALETLSFEHGVLAAATLSSKTTSAQVGSQGELRHDPMSMRPFIGYDFKSYCEHWLRAPELQRAATGGKEPLVPLPKIFHVNWFRKGADNKFLFPGFGENIRVLKWVLGRVAGSAKARETPVGNVPIPEELCAGMKISKAAGEALVQIDTNEWKTEVARMKAFLKQMDAPKELTTKADWLSARLEAK